MDRAAGLRRYSSTSRKVSVEGRGRNRVLNLPVGILDCRLTVYYGRLRDELETGCSLAELGEAGAAFDKLRQRLCQQRPRQQRPRWLSLAKPGLPSTSSGSVLARSALARSVLVG